MKQPKTMGRPKKEDAKTGAVQVRLDPERLAVLDDLVIEYQATSPGEVSRASVLRHLLDQEIARRAARKGKAKR